MFSLYDDRDPDWFLVKNSKTGEVGFVPGNYVEKQGSAPAASASASTSTPAPVPISELPPPPQRVDLKPATQSSENILPPHQCRPQLQKCKSLTLTPSLPHRRCHKDHLQQTIKPATVRNHHRKENLEHTIIMKMIRYLLFTK